MTPQPCVPPPKTKTEMKTRLKDLLVAGWLDMPTDVPRYNGTGGPGNFLEDLLGVTAGNQDIADCIGWEVKWCSPQTHLITLFHKEADDSKIMRYMVSKFGWRDAAGRLSFRHTIRGESDRFKVFSDAGNIIVRPVKGNGPVPMWSHDELMNVAGGKLRRLVVVQGVRRESRVRFDRADLYETLRLTKLAELLTQGKIAIDFDVRETRPDSKALRNHGTKFRVAPEDLRQLYEKHERL